MLLIITDGIITDMERTKESIVRVIFSIWGKVLKIGLSKFYRRQPSKNLLSPLLNTLSVFITAK